MIIQISQGQDFRADFSSRIIPYKELLLKVNSKQSFTVRRYPNNTVIMYHWGYENRCKKLFKEPHYEADRNFGNMLEYINVRYNLRLSSFEFESIVDMYNKMKMEKLRV